MKGSIPVPYIVAIILAVAIIAVIVYLFFIKSGWLQEVIMEKYCEARCTEYRTRGCVQSWPEEVDPKCQGRPCAPC